MQVEGVDPAVNILALPGLVNMAASSCIFSSVNSLFPTSFKLILSSLYLGYPKSYRLKWGQAGPLLVALFFKIIMLPSMLFK